MKLDFSEPQMGLHHLVGSSTGSGYILLHFHLQEEKKLNKYDTFFIRDKCRHLTLCLRLMEPHFHAEQMQLIPHRFRGWADTCWSSAFKLTNSTARVNNPRPGELHSTEVECLLLTWQPRAWFPAFPKNSQRKIFRCCRGYVYQERW